MARGRLLGGEDDSRVLSLGFFMDLFFCLKIPPLFLCVEGYYL
jgi:hypothetical protein